MQHSKETWTDSTTVKDACMWPTRLMCNMTYRVPTQVWCPLTKNLPPPKKKENKSKRNAEIQEEENIKM